MSQVEKDRVAAAGLPLDRVAYEAAWDAFQNAPIDLVADSDDEQCRILGIAIMAYLAAVPSYSR